MGKQRSRSWKRKWRNSPVRTTRRRALKRARPFLQPKTIPSTSMPPKCARGWNPRTATSSNPRLRHQRRTKVGAKRRTKERRQRKEGQENRERRYQQGRTTGVGGLKEQDHCKEGRAQSRRYEWRAAKQGP